MARCRHDRARSGPTHRHDHVAEGHAWPMTSAGAPPGASPAYLAMNISVRFIRRRSSTAAPCASPSAPTTAPADPGGNDPRLQHFVYRRNGGQRSASGTAAGAQRQPRRRQWVIETYAFPAVGAGRRRPIRPFRRRRVFRSGRVVRRVLKSLVRFSPVSCASSRCPRSSRASAAHYWFRQLAIISASFAERPRQAIGTGRGPPPSPWHSGPCSEVG